MINCTSCKGSNAVIILTSVQCPNPDCRFYDEGWAKELAKKIFSTQGTVTGRLPSGRCPSNRTAKKYSKQKLKKKLLTSMPW